MMPPQGANPLMISTVLPTPTLTTHQIARLRVGGKDYVAIKFDTPTGCAVFFYPPETAQGLADSIKGAAVGLSLVQQQTLI